MTTYLQDAGDPAGNSAGGSGAGAADMEPAPYFFTPSTTKFILMSLCTLGIYEVYWFYKNWKCIKKINGDDIMPFWRAFFAPIWAYSCFRHMVAVGESKSSWDSVEESSLPIGMLAFVYFVLVWLWRLPDPYALVSFLSFLPLVPMNSYAMRINARRSGFVPDDRYSGWNWVGLTLGNLLLLLSVWGSFLKN